LSIEELILKRVDRLWTGVYIPYSEYNEQKEFGMKEFIKVMKALSDPARVRILKMLQYKTMCVCEIQTALEKAQSTTSKHLKILEDAGLIFYQKDGLWVNYQISDGSQSPYAASLIGNLRHWLNDDPEIKKITARLPGIDRKEILNRN
jgi:ArsR family transcriptional regulator